MALTSCHHYCLELPVATLGRLMGAVLASPEGAGVGIPRRWENVAVSGYTATVELRTEDLASNPPVVTLPAPPPDLPVMLRLTVTIRVTLNELPDLDPVDYGVTFTLPGRFERVMPGALPELHMCFPGLSAPQLSVVITPGAITLTPALVKSRIDQLYAGDPTLGHMQQPNVSTPLGNVMVVIDIWNDDPASMGFRGQITVPTVTASSLSIRLPGHVRIFDLGTTYANSDMTLDVVVGIGQSHGELRVKLGSVASGDVSVTLATPPSNPIIAAVLPNILAGAVADKFKTLILPADGGPDLVQTLPTHAQVQAMVETRLLDLADVLSVPIFTPQAPDPGDVDLTTFEAFTLPGLVLALCFEPSADGTPCDPPDHFAQANGFALAVSATRVMELVQPVLDGGEGDREVEGYDVTVNHIGGSLADIGEHSQTRGHLWIDGDADVHVDCWPDPNVAFWGPIFLRPITQPDHQLVFEAETGGFGADDPCCADVDPSELESLVAGRRSSPFRLPSRFSEVADLTLTATEAELSRAGMVVFGTLEITSAQAAAAAGHGRPAWWSHDPPAP